jgi:DNA-binding IclR family transcriptional regulator
LNGSHVTIIDVVESEHELKITSPVGSTVSLLAGAVGKVFLSAMEEGMIDEILGSGRLSAYTEHSILDPAEYRKAVETARMSGYALDDEEYISGVRAAAALIEAPVPVPAAIWVVGFKTDLANSTMEILGTETFRAARAIAENLKVRDA